MKDQILKIAGVKTEKEFYKKYPTEEAFMAKHGKKLEKLAMGKAMVNKQLEQLTDFGNPPIAQNGMFQPLNFGDMLSGAQATNFGMSKGDYLEGRKSGQIADPMAAPKQSNGLSNFISMAGDIAGEAMGGGTMRDGGYVMIPKADFGAIAGALKGLGEKSGGIGNMLGDVLNKKGGGAKGIMGAVGPNGLLGKGGKGLGSLATKSGLGAAGKAAGLGILNAAPDILNGIGQIKEQKNQIAKADTSAQVSGLVKQANTNNPVEIQKGNYARPEDNLVQPGELAAPQGTGSNPLQMKSGGEIQNTYAPNTIYTDLQDIPEAAFGDYFQSSGQASIGKGVGSAIGNVFGGPLGGAIGGALGTVAGNLLGGARDANKLAALQSQTQRNTMETAGAQMFSGIRSGFSSFMEDGGYVSNDWQPQVIATFGEHKLSDLLRPDPTMDTLRSGGHLAQVGYTAPSMRALETAEDGTVLDSAIRTKTDLQSITDNGAFSQNLRHAISSTDTYADGRPVEKTDLYSVTKGQGDNQRVKEFLRSQVGDEAPQYSMQKTYKPLFSDKYKTVSKTIGAGRGERRMADMENFLAEGKMEDGGYMAMGGNLQTHWGGRHELMSYNPYIPGGGETVMFRGQSHDDTNSKGQSGIGITYGDNPVEVERGEPMTEMNDGGVVFGNMKIDQFAANEINDPKAKGKKYKNYVADLSKTEAKQNKILDKASELALDKNVNNAFDQLSLNSSQASIIGANMKLKDIAQKKLNAAAVQNAILETAEERGLVSDDLSQGKIKEAKFGASVIAQSGFNTKGMRNVTDKKKTTTSSKSKSSKKDNVKLYDINKTKPYFTDYDLPSGFTPGITPLGDNTGGLKQGVIATINQSLGFTAPKQNIDVPFKPGYKVPEIMSGYDKSGNYFDAQGNLVDQSGGDLPNSPIGKSFGNINTEGEGKTDWAEIGQAALSNLAPLLRPTDQEGLDPAQLYPEMLALATNQLEPVQAQKYQPLLQGAPSDISYQDQLNEITAQSRAAERMAQYNPEAAASIFANVSQAKNKVLAEQFRANQARKEEVYAQNRNLLNQAQLQNLQILDNQYVRQQQAQSNTKAQALEAMKSIAEKTAKNKLENRQLGIYENLYKYRYDNQGRAINFNDPYQFNNPLVGSSPKPKDASGDDLIPIYNDDNTIKGYKVKKDSKKENGAIVKAIKNL